MQDIFLQTLQLLRQNDRRMAKTVDHQRGMYLNDFIFDGLQCMMWLKAA